MNTSDFARVMQDALGGNREAAARGLLEARRRMLKDEALTLWFAAYGPLNSQVGLRSVSGVSLPLVRSYGARRHQELIAAGPLSSLTEAIALVSELVSSGVLHAEESTGLVDVTGLERLNPLIESGVAA